MVDTLIDSNFQTVFDAAANAMLLIENSGHIVLVNQAAQQLLGYSADELEGIAIETLIAPRYGKQYRYSYQELFYNKTAKSSVNIENELVVLDHDRKEILLEVSLRPIQAQQQQFILIIFNVANQHLEAGEALRASEERLRLAKQAAGLGIFDYDCIRNIIYWDKQMRELWGEHSETVSYEEFVAMIHPEDRAARQAAIDYAMDPTSNGEFRAEYRVINPNSGAERWISAMGRVYFKAGCANRLVGVTRDVTEQKNIQKKLQAHRNEAENIFKQQVAARTASAIAHELNQPLAAISAYSEVLLHALHNDVSNSDSMKRALEGCVEQAQRAGRSLHELLAFLQKGELVTERLNLNDVIHETLSIICNDGYGEFHAVLHLEENIPAVQCNHTQVQKALLNLFRNAIEAMHMVDLPTLTIETAVQTVAEASIAIVTIQDNGPGLDQAVAKRMFEPFFTTKPTGIGMGLAISRALIEANGGQLWVDPDAKPGAKFHFTLPFAPDHA